MGWTSKPLFTFWFGWEYLSTLNHALVQFSEPAPCLAIANCVYYTVSKEKAFPLRGKMHFHRIMPFLTTKDWPPSDFLRSSLIEIHGGAPKNWRCVFDFVCSPPLLQVQQWIQSMIVGFPCLQASLDLGKEKNKSSFLFLSTPSSFSINTTN